MLVFLRDFNSLRLGDAMWHCNTWLSLVQWMKWCWTVLPISRNAPERFIPDCPLYLLWGKWIQVTSHYLNHWCSSLLMHICVTRPQWVKLKCSDAMAPYVISAAMILARYVCDVRKMLGTGIMTLVLWCHIHRLFLWGACIVRSYSSIVYARPWYCDVIFIDCCCMCKLVLSWYQAGFNAMACHLLGDKHHLKQCWFNIN